MVFSENTALIEPEDLLKKLSNKENVKIIDGSFSLPGSGDIPYENFQRKRIGKSVFFNIDEIADKNTDLPHMLPTADEFAMAVGRLGISGSDEVVIYGQNNPVMGPCRVWWSFRVFGHDNVKILNGSLKHWEKSGYPLNTHLPDTPIQTEYKPQYRAYLVSNIEEVRKACSNKNIKIIDARPHDRFYGKAAEPRPGLKRGAIEGSINIPCISLIDPASGKIKSHEKLEKIITEHNITEVTPVIATCGSGVTACSIALVLHEFGNRNVAVYDGSWAEWGKE